MLIDFFFLQRKYSRFPLRINKFTYYSIASEKTLRGFISILGIDIFFQIHMHLNDVDEMLFTKGSN